MKKKEDLYSYFLVWSPASKPSGVKREQQKKTVSPIKEIEEKKKKLLMKWEKFEKFPRLESFVVRLISFQNYTSSQRKNKWVKKNN